MTTPRKWFYPTVAMSDARWDDVLACLWRSKLKKDVQLADRIHAELLPQRERHDEREAARHEQ